MNTAPHPCLSPGEREKRVPRPGNTKALDGRWFRGSMREFVRGIYQGLGDSLWRLTLGVTRRPRLRHAPARRVALLGNYFHALWAFMLAAGKRRPGVFQVGGLCPIAWRRSNSARNIL